VHIVKWCWKSCCACCKDDGNHQERTWSQWPCMWFPLHRSTTMWRSSTNLDALNKSPITSFQELSSWKLLYHPCLWLLVHLLILGWVLSCFHLISSFVIYACDFLSNSSYLVESLYSIPKTKTNSMLARQEMTIIELRVENQYTLAPFISRYLHPTC